MKIVIIGNLNDDRQKIFVNNFFTQFPINVDITKCEFEIPNDDNSKKDTLEIYFFDLSDRRDAIIHLQKTNGVILLGSKTKEELEMFLLIKKYVEPCRIFLYSSDLDANKYIFQVYNKLKRLQQNLSFVKNFFSSFNNLNRNQDSDNNSEKKLNYN